MRVDPTPSTSIRHSNSVSKMTTFPSLQTLKKWKSLCSISDNEVKFFKIRRHSRTLSVSSVEVCVNESDSDEDRGRRLGDSGIDDKQDGDVLSLLEQKIDKLNDMFVEQCRQLTTLKEEIHNSKMVMERSEYTHNQLLTETMKTAITQRIQELEKVAESGAADMSKSRNSRAQSLLDAIEFKKAFSLDGEIKEALTKFLQSEELKDQMVQATADSVFEVIEGTVSRDVSSLYLPILERSHRRLVRHISRVVEEAFIELEENSALLSKSVYNASRTLRRALDRHQCLMAATADPGKNHINTLQCAVEELLHKELKQWREKVLDMFSFELHPEPLVETEGQISPLEYTPVSPLQPPGADTTIIDQMMRTAEINKKIQDGDINGSFAKALSASDLSLVMAACRAAEPVKVFAPPCCLELPVVLSLVQQLATDMVHETQLKCRYLEDAIISLNSSKTEIQPHLPLVVGELRKHLSRFLTSYPSHVANRRISLIVMAADNLLK